MTHRQDQAIIIITEPLASVTFCQLAAYLLVHNIPDCTAQQSTE